MIPHNGNQAADALLLPLPVQFMKAIHPATSDSIRRAAIRRRRRNAVTRASLFGFSFVASVVVLFPLADQAQKHSETQRGAIAAAALMGSVVLAGSSLILSAAAAEDAQ